MATKPYTAEDFREVFPDVDEDILVGRAASYLAKLRGMAHLGDILTGHYWCPKCRWPVPFSRRGEMMACPHCMIPFQVLEPIES